MPKRISSPSLRWPGFVVFSDPLTLPQALAWEKANSNAAPYRAKFREALKDESWQTVDITEIHAAMFPGVMACVEKWELEGIDDPPNPFPASPRKPAMDLFVWLMNEISRIYAGEEEKADPNE